MYPESRNNNRRRPRATPARGTPQVNVGRFTRCPPDPPPAFKAGWKSIVLGQSLGSTTVTITLDTLKTALTTLGIAANAVKLTSISCWSMPFGQDGAANSAPRIVMSVRDPVGRGTLGTREDTGQVARAACLKYSFSDTVRETSIDLPTQGTGPTIAVIEASLANGDFQVACQYNI
jgi:hypothetical protein